MLDWDISVSQSKQISSGKEVSSFMRGDSRFVIQRSLREWVG